MTVQFKWVEFYTELATKLLEYKNNRTSLIELLQELYSRIGMKLPTLDSYPVPHDIDPFTIFGLFNKGITDANRISILNGIKSAFDISADTPNDFSGIPVLNNMMATFYAFEDDNRRKSDDINNLWEIFECAIILAENDSEQNRATFSDAYNKVKLQFAVRWNLTMGLYWIRPYTFINLDKTNRAFLSDPNNIPESIAEEIKALKSKPPLAEKYLDICDKCRTSISSGEYGYSSLPELSYQAWKDSDKYCKVVGETTTKYWLYSPGENASNWDELYDAGIVGIGWDLIGDLRKYDSQDDIDNALQKTDDSNASQKINAKALWQFANDMKPGDVVFAKKGTGLIIGKGIVKSDYLFDDERTELKHVRKIDWTNKGEWENPGSAIRKTLTEITLQEADKLNALFKDDLQFKNDFSWMLYKSKNLILRGAPGTGKSYLAKEIAADIITNGQLIDGKPIKFAELTDEQKKQVAFVQFHPNYDYSDFVEGLRPVKNDDGTMCFDLKDGVFKVFVDQARKNYEDSLKTLEDIEKESSIQEAINQFLLSLDNKHSFKTISGTEFEIEKFDDERIYINVPQNQSTKLTVRVDEVKKMLESDVNFTMIKDVTSFFGKTFAKQAYSYNFAIYKAIMDKKASLPKTPAKQTELKKYVFIIDEINRGEISKIFGELFYSIDPGYRGRDGEIFTQYSNMHSDPNEKFYIPDNVYIIGTMNDIDRSVDSFDFAMRRRFRFVELKASEQLKMLDSLNDDVKEDAKHRMEGLNKAIVNEKELNENYQIGAAYFLKLKYLSFDRLWTDYLEPLLHEYVRGMYDESDIMKRLADAYGYKNSTEGDADESDQN